MYMHVPAAIMSHTSVPLALRHAIQRLQRIAKFKLCQSSLRSSFAKFHTRQVSCYIVFEHQWSHTACPNIKITKMLMCSW